MKKALIVSTVSRQFYLFEQGNIEVLKSLGYEIHGAANFYDANERLDSLGIIRHPFDIQRSPFSFKNIRAYKQLKKIIESSNYEIIHCHTPMGGVLTRLAAKKARRKGTKLIYTAHGFHFYKGAPLKNWLLYYPVEKLLSLYTDVLITINREDYNIAQRFKAKKIVYVPGVGVDVKKFSNVTVDKTKKRKEIGISNSAFAVLSVGELSKRKNHEVVIKALAKINNPGIIYIICGQGELYRNLKRKARELKVNVKFLSFRNDIPEVCAVVDLFVFPSYREGLPVALMEAMASRLPVVCSNIRGNSDLIENGKGGYLVNPDDVEGFAKSINKVLRENIMRKVMGEKNYQEVKKYDKQIVRNIMENIYRSIV